MCGIAGIWHKNKLKGEAREQVTEALNYIKHRGPDHSQVAIAKPNCILGHVRLSVIDTDARSNQPFYSSDQRYVLVFNGEIYNYRLLRKELEQKGVTFHTSSDTEVLLQLLIHEDISAIDRLDGFYAFAFYDTETDRLVLARDRMGIKPLLVAESEEGLIFASELNAFFAFDIDKTLSAPGMNYFFGLTYVPAPYTALQKVKKLRPGQVLIRTKTAVEEKQVTVKSLKQPDSFESAKTELNKRLTQAVRDRMVADVPLGCFLSGGVDSSVIAALACREKPDLKTFSVGFDHTYFNETAYAQQVADRIGSDHTVFTLTQTDFKANFEAFLQAIDEPFADSSAFAMFLLAKKTRKEVTVALSGDGADELFGGYRKHRAELMAQQSGAIKKGGIKLAAQLLAPVKSNRSDRVGELSRKIKKMGSALSLSPQERYWKWCHFIEAGDRRQLFQKNFAVMQPPFLMPEGDWDLNTVLWADQQMVLPNDMLKKTDVMSMASGLEVRTPFMAAQVVNWANALPVHYKLNKNTGKYILKETFAHLLPEAVLNRPKKGFEIPIKEWLGAELDELLNGPFFQPEYLDKQGLFEAKAISQLKKQWHNPQFGDKIYLVWALIVFQYWWNRYYGTN